MEQLIAHLFGDYVFQNQWMADNKTSNSGVAAIHAFIYSLMFLPLVNSSWAYIVIALTHFFIDRFRLAQYWVNLYGIGTGPNVPPFLSIWLLIIVDNTFHLTINYLSIRYL
jgi:hypothetical protein